jgi:hypothetical protein
MPGNYIPRQLINGMDCIGFASLVDKVRYERIVWTRFGVDCLRLTRFCQGKSREGPNEWVAGCSVRKRYRMRHDFSIDNARPMSFPSRIAQCPVVAPLYTDWAVLGPSKRSHGYIFHSGPSSSGTLFFSRRSVSNILVRSQRHIRCNFTMNRVPTLRFTGSEPVTTSHEIRFSGNDSSPIAGALGTGFVEG